MYFDAQDRADAGDELSAARLLQRIVQTTVTTEGSRIISSAAHNCLAEAQIDRAVALGFPMSVERPSEIAPVLEARRLLGRALKLWPQNAQAAMSLALLERDCGNAECALHLWSMVAALPSTTGGGLDDEWAEAWILEPRRRCLPLAAMYSALLLSQLGRHAQATPYLRCFGFTRALAPGVWAAARTPPSREVKRGGDGGAASCPVRYFADALRTQTHESLLAAFAPGAAYWRETGYEQASANKQYFTFGVDVAALRSGARAPSNLAEATVVQLLPLLGHEGDALVSAEWWVHSRLAGRNVGHELHYDLEERVLEATVCHAAVALAPPCGLAEHAPPAPHAHTRTSAHTHTRAVRLTPVLAWSPCPEQGRVVHPTFSSVVYLTGGGDPTLVLDETLDGAAASRAWLVHPRRGAFMTFPGNLLHGVVPTSCRTAATATSTAASTPSGFAAAAASRASAAAQQQQPPPAQRLTLLIAWYSEQTQHAARRKRLGPQSAVPRCTRSQTWPATLQLSPDRDGEPPPAAAVPTQLAVPEASPVWVEVPPSPDARLRGQQRVGAAAAADAKTDIEPPLAVPPSLQQHFFLRTADDVKDRLYEEHGIGGSWAEEGATAQGRKRGRSS